MRSFWMFFIALVTNWSCTKTSLNSGFSKEQISAAQTIAGREYVRDGEACSEHDPASLYCTESVEFLDTRKVVVTTQGRIFSGRYRYLGNDIKVVSDEVQDRANETPLDQEEKLDFKFTLSKDAKKIKDDNNQIYSIVERE